MCLFEQKQKQQQITIDDKNDENSLENSGGGSDESDIEISQDTERQQTQADEKQEPGIVSIDVNTKTADPRNEGDDVCSASVPETPPVQEIETVTIGSSAENQVLVDHGIFSGSRQHQVKRAGPMITEIVLDEGDCYIVNKFSVLRLASYDGCSLSILIRAVSTNVRS